MVSNEFLFVTCNIITLIETYFNFSGTVKGGLSRGRWGSVKDSGPRPSGDSDSGSDCVHTLHTAPLYILSDKTHYKVSELNYFNIFSHKMLKLVWLVSFT